MKSPRRHAHPTHASAARLLCLSLAGLGLAPAAGAQVSSVNGQIAYVACGASTIPFGPGTQCDIWVMNADGTGQTNLTATTDVDEQSPAWSADGTRLAYVETYPENRLMVMDADGAAKTAVAASASSPTWSPGGTQIAFVRTNPGSPVSLQWDVVVVDLATGSETVISRPASFGGVLADADEFEPAWSPDGAKIAFVGVRPERYPDPITGAPTDAAQHEIVIVDPDGGGEQILTAGDPGTDRADYLEEDRAPAWSPDGSMLVFMSQAQVPSCCGPWQIWAVNRDGSAATNLSNDPAVNDLWPSWSPDGTQIVFQRSNGSGGFDLYTMPAPSALPLANGGTAPQALRLEAGVTAAASGATPVANGQNAADPDWGRNPDAPPPGGQRYGLFVSVTVSGKGAGGSVASQPAGIRCGRDCAEVYAAGTVVTLSATPKKGSTFAGWSGACSGTAPSCTVAMIDVRSVAAAFLRSR